MNRQDAFKLAIANIAAFSDTDVFPSPLDRLVCQDSPDLVLKMLEDVDRTFDQYLASFPPENIDTLAPLGYTAFRWTTQIDPVWNAYFLSLVLIIAETIEAKRLPTAAKNVFSYRFQPDLRTGHLFGDSTWRHYKQNALKRSHDFPFVLVADVADFYPRVAHHRLENELIRLSVVGDEPRRIKTLMAQFSRTRSYGLPVGGPASRILAELALNPVDLYLSRKGISFCRYVDDFHIFAASKQEAFSHLAFLSQILFNEGLSLQKTKTRILTSEELRDASSHLDLAATDDATALPPEARLMRLSVRFDPYSPTAQDDYEQLKNAVSSIDIVGILAREIAKTNIDTQVTKQAIAAIRALAPEFRGGAVTTLLDPSNLETLAPVFSNIMRMLRSLFQELDEPTQAFSDEMMLKLLREDSHLIQNDLNLSYLLQVFGQRQSSVKESVLMDLFEKRPSPLIRREIILIMAKWGSTYWLSDLMRRFGSLTGWERKAFIVASFYLSDEGEHWRKHTKRTLSQPETVIRDWYQERMKRTTNVPV
ncbi:MAG TPA: RNA-directed DNA polymerase [Opitutaceae bacterium]|nr:RNA-directed DNA polymerase [Opitutaceae bacterium]